MNNRSASLVLEEAKGREGFLQKYMYMYPSANTTCIYILLHVATHPRQHVISIFRDYIHVCIRSSPARRAEVWHLPGVE